MLFPGWDVIELKLSPTEEWEYREDILATCVSGIFALARLDSVTTKRGQAWRTSDRYGWLLSVLVVLPTPVQVRGSRDLWEVTGKALATVAEQLGVKLAVTPAPHPVTAPAPAVAPTTPQAGGAQARRAVLPERGSDQAARTPGIGPHVRPACRRRLGHGHLPARQGRA